MLERFLTLSPRSQISCLVLLSEKVVDRLRGIEGYEEAKRAIRRCAEWSKVQREKGDDLYSMLEDGSDESGLFIYIGYIDMEEEIEQAWDCVVSTVAYAAYWAYAYEGQKYIPQTLESIDKELIEHFFASFYALDPSHQKIVAETIVEVESFLA
ncbi:Imm6 family immunity protein [Priestia endophytica]|uniref:Imm6 family immunity protein n=1 Tax=Priestia endophytica TaxID=135735 RepID=UPI002E20864A|nr:Imm6 family immunity protein [Priestia endophytica]